MGLTSPFQAGAAITAASLQFVAPLAAFKYADQNSGMSNTALVSDTDLNLALTASGVYTGYGMIVFAASTTAKYQCAFTVPSGATGGWNPNIYVASGGGVQATASFISFGAANTIVQATNGTAMNLSFTFQFSVVMSATAGNIQYQFAQSVSDASNCNTRAGSFLLAWRIA